MTFILDAPGKLSLLKQRVCAALSQRADLQWGRQRPPHLASAAHVNHQVVLFKEPAGIANVDSCLRLVTRQHPHLDPCLPQCHDGVGDTLLETVLNARRPFGRKPISQAWLIKIVCFSSVYHCGCVLGGWMLPSRERFVSSCAALSLTSSSLLSMAARAICLFTDQLLYALSLTTCSTHGKKDEPELM